MRWGNSLSQTRGLCPSTGNFIGWLCRLLIVGRSVPLFMSSEVQNNLHLGHSRKWVYANVLFYPARRTKMHEGAKFDRRPAALRMASTLRPLRRAKEVAACRVLCALNVAVSTPLSDSTSSNCSMRIYEIKLRFTKRVLRKFNFCNPIYNNHGESGLHDSENRTTSSVELYIGNSWPNSGAWSDRTHRTRTGLICMCHKIDRLPIFQILTNNR